MSRRHFHNSLRTLRMSSGLSQSELAMLLGVSRSAVCKYEGGYRRLSIRHLTACEIIFGVGAGEILATVRDRIEDELGARLLKLHDAAWGRTDPLSVKKVAFLHAIICRLHEVRYTP